MLAVTTTIMVAGCGASSAETVTITKHGHGVVRTRTATVTETSTTPEVATNLTVTPRVRHLVYLAAVAGMTPADRKQTKGPLPGMYYGEYRGVRYALASVSFPLTVLPISHRSTCSCRISHGSCGSRRLAAVQSTKQW